MKNIITTSFLFFLFSSLPIGVIRAAIVANFADGPGNTSSDQYPGIAGNGWQGGWSMGTGATGSTTTNTTLATNANPLTVGGDQYLSVTLNTGTSINDNWTTARRQFGAFDGVDPTKPHTINFDFRPEAKNEIPDAEFRSRYQIFGNSSEPGDTSTATTWWIVAAAGTTGSAPTGVVINNWGFLTNPNPLTTPAPTGMNFVDSGITMNANTVYHFQIKVYPASKTYVATVSDGTDTFTSGTLYFRNQNAAAQSASYLAFGARQQNIDNQGLANYPFSFDSVSIVPTPPTGDFDADGDVDGADFIAWQTNFPITSAATLGQGDGDYDQDVDGADFAAWQNGFPTPSSGIAPVPEPSVFLLATMGVVASLVYRRRNN
jgi:hypothetical protein